MWSDGKAKSAGRRRRGAGRHLMERAMKFEIPRPMKVEHDELHEALVHATKAGGETGAAAKAVAKVLHAHFVKEEEYALPPLGLLPALAGGKFEPGMAEVLAMTDKLASELPQMLAEHKQIVAALEKLLAAAKAENKPDIADFAEKLKLHAQAEEQVAYPTTLLIGRYVKAQLAAAR
jgi:hypothetical protein